MSGEAGGGARRVLVISDTHGLLRPEVTVLAAAADVVVHAGDVGTPAVLDGLRAAAPGPVYAVRGNVDRSPDLAVLPGTLTLTLGGVVVHVLHDLNALRPAVDGTPYGVVVSGHTHAPRVDERDGVTYLNPGSVGPRRFRLPVACAWLHVDAGTVRAEPVTLDP